jgi:hypothetical protein
MPSNYHSINCEFHDQGDAKWIVIRGQQRGHNDMPCRRPTPGWPIGRPGVGCPQGVFCWVKLLLISNVLFKHCPPDLGIHLMLRLRFKVLKKMFGSIYFVRLLLRLIVYKGVEKSFL